MFPPPSLADGVAYRTARRSLGSNAARGVVLVVAQDVRMATILQAEESEHGAGSLPTDSGNADWYGYTDWTDGIAAVTV